MPSQRVVSTQAYAPCLCSTNFGFLTSNIGDSIDSQCSAVPVDEREWKEVAESWCNEAAGGYVTVDFTTKATVAQVTPSEFPTGSSTVLATPSQTTTEDSTESWRSSEQSDWKTTIFTPTLTYIITYTLTSQASSTSSTRTTQNPKSYGRPQSHSGSTVNVGLMLVQRLRGPLVWH